MLAASQPLVSVVTPAYNEEKSLAACIESVLSQTYSNWDYTIVNNCSTDGTLAIAEKYAAQDSRIRVITNDTFVSAVANFNLAFRRISAGSKYAKMLLADDLLFPECLERMVGIAEEHASVGIVGAYGLDGRWVLWMGIPYPQSVVGGREICRQRLLGGPYVFGSQTSVMFQSDMVRNRNPFYDESSEHPDSKVCFDLLKDCDFGFVHQVLTLSPERPGSLLSRSRNLNTLAAGTLEEMVTYGPYYLNPAEFQKRLKIVVANYYMFLAGGFLRLRNKEFWDYHKRKLKDAGIDFKFSRLAYVVCERILDRFRIRRKHDMAQWGLQ